MRESEYDNATSRDSGAHAAQRPYGADSDDAPTQVHSTFAQGSSIHDTAVISPAPLAADTTEADRAAARAERQRALGIRSRSEDTGDTAVAVRPRRTTDRWHGSLALHLLRWITAAIMGVRAYQHLTHLTRTTDWVANSVLPQPHYFAWGIGIAEAVIAVLLIIGGFTRLAGLALMVLSIGELVFFIWGKANPFSAERIGFNGELELVLAGLGLLFLLLGSGGWGMDAMFRRKRWAAKDARAMGNPV